MSKAKERALEAYPEDWWFANPGDWGIVKNPRQKDYNAEKRTAYILGYKQAEKDITEMAIAWLKEHADDYIVDLTPTYPNAPVNTIVGGKCWEDLKEYLEVKK